MDPHCSAALVFIEILGQVYPGFKIYGSDHSGAVHLESMTVDCQIVPSLCPVGSIHQLLLLLADTGTVCVFYLTDGGSGACTGICTCTCAGSCD